MLNIINWNIEYDHINARITIDKLNINIIKEIQTSTTTNDYLIGPYLSPSTTRLHRSTKKKKRKIASPKLENSRDDRIGIPLLTRVR